MLEPGYRSVRNYSELMELLKSNFPEIYTLYVQGQIVLDDMYEYTKDGQPKVHISYHYR